MSFNFFSSPTLKIPLSFLTSFISFQSPFSYFILPHLLFSSSFPSLSFISFNYPYLLSSLLCLPHIPFISPLPPSILQYLLKFSFISFNSPISPPILYYLLQSSPFISFISSSPFIFLHLLSISLSFFHFILSPFNPPYLFLFFFIPFQSLISFNTPLPPLNFF